MSKIAFLFFVFFFVSAANASFISDELHAVQQQVDGIVGSAISEVKLRFEAVRERAAEKLKKVEDAAHDINKKLTDYVASLIQKTKDEIRRVLNRGKDTDVSKCAELLNDVDNLSVSIYSKMTGCVVAKIRAGVSYMDKMKKTSDEVIANLEALRVEAAACGNNVNNTRSALRAVFCVKVVAAKATWAAAKAVPSVTLNLSKLTLLLGTLQPSLVYCTKKEAFSLMVSESANIVKKTGTCVHERISSSIGKQTTPVPNVADETSTVNTDHDHSELFPSSTQSDHSASTEAPVSSEDPASSEVPASTEAPATSEVPASSEDHPSSEDHAGR